MVKAAAVVLVAASSFAAGWWVNGDRWSDKYDAREQEISAERMAWGARVARAQDNFTAAQSAAKRKFDADQKQADDRLRAALDRLRSYERTPADGASTDGGPGDPGADAAGLPMLDGEVAVRLAAGADEVARRLARSQAALDACVRAASLE